MGIVNILEESTMIQKYFDKLECWIETSTMNFSGNKCKVPHMVGNIKTTNIKWIGVHWGAVHVEKG